MKKWLNVIGASSTSESDASEFFHQRYVTLLCSGWQGQRRFSLAQRQLMCLCWGTSEVFSTQGRDSLHRCSSMSSSTAGMVKRARALCFRCLQLWMWAALGFLEERISYIMKVVLPAEANPWRINNTGTSSGFSFLYLRPKDANTRLPS